jgi:hypothetical protein
MSKEDSKREFRGFLKKLYGTQVLMGEALGVTPNTVTNWVQTNPIPMLQFSAKIIADCDTTHTQLVGEVLYHKSKLEADET